MGNTMVNSVTTNSESSENHSTTTRDLDSTLDLIKRMAIIMAIPVEGQMAFADISQAILVERRLMC